MTHAKIRTRHRAHHNETIVCSIWRSPGRYFITVVRYDGYRSWGRFDHALDSSATCTEKPLLYSGRTCQGQLGLRGWEFCTICPFFAHFSTFTKISQVPSFQAHSPVKTIFRQNAKNARKSQNTPSTNPYQNETQFSPLSLKSRTSGHPDRPKV